MRRKGCAATKYHNIFDIPDTYWMVAPDLMVYRYMYTFTTPLIQITTVPDCATCQSLGSVSRDKTDHCARKLVVEIRLLLRSVCAVSALTFTRVRL